MMGDYADCKRCHNRKRIQARGLCNACYGNLLKYDPGLLLQFDRVTDDPSIPFVPYCQCLTPVAKRIPWFNTYQCDNCGKPFKHGIE